MAETALLVHASPAAAEVGEEPQPPAAPAAALAKTAVTEAVVRERLLALLQQSDLQTTTGAPLPMATAPLVEGGADRCPLQSARCASSWRQSWAT